uniref:Uncharacterized protein n=1 Tax=Amphimedon queenslandica TaxID=400682 RepID=A0A1X7TI53_AMPQE
MHRYHSFRQISQVSIEIRERSALIRISARSAFDPRGSVFQAGPFSTILATPLELLMGRQLRNNIPNVEESLVPSWEYLKPFREADILYKEKLKQNYDHHYKTRSLPSLPDNREVYIRTGGRAQATGVVTAPSGQPRSYQVATDKGTTTRRNRRDLIPIPTAPLGASQSQEEPPTSTPRVSTRSTTGTPIRPPVRLTAWKRGDVV